MQHLRYAEADPATQTKVLAAMVLDQPVLMRILYGARRLGLPDALLGAGAIYNTVWNVLTERPPLTGVKDADVAYFDESDLSYEAEDVVIRRAAAEFADLALPVEVRNQARVHLWYPQKFGTPYPRLTCSADMMQYYASKTHAVAVRLKADDSLEVIAPFGLRDLFSFRITPNPALDNRSTHSAKGERARSIWPEISVVPWPD